jgi:hypothetical protein
MRQRLAVLFILAVITAWFPQTALACWSDNAFYTSWTNDPRRTDLNDFGMIFMDSHPIVAWCGPGAADRLRQKLQAMPDDAFRGFLAGGELALAYATALQLGPRGLITPELDAQLARAGRLYHMDLDTTDGGCGFANGAWVRGNTCMDDYAIGATAYAWEAAYFSKTNRAGGWDARSNAYQQIQNMLGSYDSVCAHDPNVLDATRGPCLMGTQPLAISLNHSVQSPAYGIGLVTSLSVALIGLDVMGSPLYLNTLSTEQQTYLKQLWTEGQLHTDSGGSFLANCYSVTNPWQETQQTTPCDDPLFHYNGRMFPVAYTFNRYGLTPPPAQGNGFGFNTFDTTGFNVYDRNEFYGAGRFAFYYILTEGYNDYAETSWPRPSQFGAGPDYYIGLRDQYSQWWMSAEGNGGGAVDANRTSQGVWESFYLHDVNGGDLLSGDQVTIRTTSGYYFSADQGGGGALTADRLAANEWETFTILDQYGSNGGRILDGQIVELRTSDGAHYVTLVNGGGSGVDATGTSIGPSQSLRMWHVVDYQ